MILGLEIENYKCFKARTYVPFAPITVLVGQNSSGKSAILQLLAGLKQTLDAPGNTECALFSRRQKSGDVDLGPVERFFHLGLMGEGFWLGFHFDLPTPRGTLGWRARIATSEQGAIDVPMVMRHEFYSVESGDLILAFDLNVPRQVIGQIETGMDEFDPFDEAVQMECPYFDTTLLALLEAQGVTAADCRAVLRKNFLPPAVYYNSETTYARDGKPVLVFRAEKQLPYSADPAREVGRFFERVDFYSPIRGVPAREMIVETIEPGGGSWEDGSNALRVLAQDESLLSEVNGWLRSLTDHSLERVEIPSRGVTVKIRDERMGGGPSLDLADVGYGITHLLPIVTMLMSREERVVLVSQPETHVHPSLQAELGELFVHAWELRKTRSIIETHSEHLIRRLQRRVRGGRLKPEDVAILYVDRTPEGSTVTRLRMDAAGDFIDNWPRGFFPEALNETLGD